MLSTEQIHQALVNEYWTRPLKEDTPPSKEIVEEGCYW